MADWLDDIIEELSPGRIVRFEDGEEVQVEDADLVAAAEEYSDVDAQIKALEERKKALQQYLKDEMPEGGAVALEDEGTYLQVSQWDDLDIRDPKLEEKLSKRKILKKCQETKISKTLVKKEAEKDGRLKAALRWKTAYRVQVQRGRKKTNA